jgi:2-methylisocitrate lyase-like PEP mutase family enzyme
MKPTTQLRHYLAQNKLYIAPGVFDGLSALLTQQAGFSLLYASGGAIARAAGYPDLGLLSVSEVCYRLADIVEASQVPIIADADTGFGNSINVARTIRLLEKIGVAGLHLEDQEFPKRCGHLDGKSLVSTDEMVQKIKVAKESVEDKDFVIIARTDAIAVEGFAAAIERAKHYVAAGADMIFVEAPTTVEQIEAIAKEITIPKLINMFQGGKTPMVPADQLAAWGYQVMIIPSDLQRAAIYAMQETLQAIQQDGNSARCQDRMVSFNDREKIIDTERYLAIDKR